jgi:hypothetical protein
MRLIFLGGLGLSALGTSAAIWLHIPAPDGEWWVWGRKWNENWQGKPKEWHKTCLVSFVDYKSHKSCLGAVDWPPLWEASDEQRHPIDIKYQLKSMIYNVKYIFRSWRTCYINFKIIKTILYWTHNQSQSLSSVGDLYERNHVSLQPCSTLMLFLK